jgi:DNA-binding GntR family transcriptional regulator
MSEVPLRATVRDRIRRQIIAGTLAPGARLVERNLATELGVSRVPVREALRDLVAEGYAVDRATRGIAVRDYPAAEIDELFEIRGALEGVLLRRACAGLTEAGTAELRHCLTEARSALDAGDSFAAVAANARFHEVLEQVAAGPMLREMLLGIRDRMRWLLRQHDNPAQILGEHEALLDAICAGDRSTAERIFQQHLVTSRSAATEHAAVSGQALGADHPPGIDHAATTGPAAGAGR